MGERGRWFLIPRNGKIEEARYFEAPDADQFIFHHVNIHEDGNKVMIDSISLEGGLNFSLNVDNVTKDYMKAKEYGGTGSWTGLFRHELDLETGKATRTRLSDRGCEFPTINPNHVGVDYKYGYAGASANEGAWY